MAMSLLQLILFRLKLVRPALEAALGRFWWVLNLKPVMGGSPDGDDDDDADKDKAGGGDGDDDDDADKDKAGSDDDDDDDDDDDADGDTSKPDPTAEWKRRARKAQRDLKKLQAKANELELKARESDDKNKTDRDKELDRVKRETEEALNRKFDTERRQDRLEIAVTQIATKGVKIEFKEGKETTEKTVKFADPEDALVHLERAIAKGDIDDADIFEGNKVNKEALSDALSELLERKPHLGAEGKKRKSEMAGDVDQGKGGKAAGGGIEDMTPDDHFKAIKRGA